MWLDRQCRLELYVHANEEQRQAVLVARFDNLGKGASGAITAWVALASAQSGGSLSNPNRSGDAGSSGRRSP